MSASAGRVLLIPRGAYNASETYTPLDLVKYGVSTYLCKAETTGNIPTNTTYWQLFAEGVENVSPEAIGIGVAISSDTGSSRTAALTDYNLTPNGIVAVTFASDVPANATLNINSQGAKAIYYRGSALVANVIRGGDTVTFGYDGTRYNVLCIDGGAGHEIENSAGTKLTQRDVMQVTDGLEAVDDSTNQKTKIKMNLPIVSSADWNAMTEQEKTAYKASHYRFGVEVPDTEGVINAEYMKLLWENPNTAQAFVAQTVTLSSADYDFLIIIAGLDRSAYKKSVIIPKGSSGLIDFAYQDSTTSPNQETTISRRILASTDTTVSFDNAEFSHVSSVVTNNTLAVPIAIYGIKKNFQFKVNAIATDLSTRADHCFLSDDETTVEDKLEELEQEYVEISYTSSETWRTVLTRLRSAVDMSKITDKSRLVPSEYEVYYVDSPKVGQYSRGGVDASQFVEKTVRIDNQTGYLWGSLSGLQNITTQGVGVGGTLRLYY